MNVSVSLSDDGSRASIRINGRFDFSLHSDFRKSYKDLEVTNGEYIVDLSGTDYIDSSALGMLLLLKEHAESQSSIVRLINFSPKIREILTIASFDKLFAF